MRRAIPAGLSSLPAGCPRPGRARVSVRHILPDGATATQTDVEADLLRRTGRDKEDLFMSAGERLAAAYRDHARKVAFATAEQE